MTGIELNPENYFSELRKNAEKKLKQKSISKNGYELDVHKEELEMQADELQLIQLKLLNSLDEYTQLFNLSPIAHFVLDKNGNILNFNNTALNLIGLDYQQLKGKAFSLLLNGKAFQDDYYRYRNHIYETGTCQQLESEILRKDGKIISVLVENVVVKDEKKQFKHFLSTVVNISERKERELKLKDTLIKEKELSSMKSRFVSMASHEFRTPLAAIQTSADIIGMHIKKNNISNSEKHIKRISTSIKHLTDILNNFLSLDKLEHGEIKIGKDIVDVKKLISEIIRESALTTKKGQTIEYTFEGKTEFKVDPKCLYSILLNLLSNAIKYSPEGNKIECDVSVASDKLQIKVTDYGIGIPSSEQGKIFSRLFRAKNSEMIEGTGLGLNIAKKNTELLNGKISFTSKENIGSTFIVEIPY